MLRRFVAAPGSSGGVIRPRRLPRPGRRKKEVERIGKDADIRAVRLCGKPWSFRLAIVHGCIHHFHISSVQAQKTTRSNESSRATERLHCWRTERERLTCGPQLKTIHADQNQCRLGEGQRSDRCLRACLDEPFLSLAVKHDLGTDRML